MKIMKKAVSILLTLTMVLTIFTIVPVTVSAASQSVTYVDENGETQTVTAAILTGKETELSPGWYAVTEDIRFEDVVNLLAPDSEKDINLILCDSSTMLLADEMYGFYSEDSVSLNIYGQGSSSGALKSQGGDFIFLIDPNASLNMFGGELTSSYINADYCTVTCAGDINISGGSVEKCELVSYNNLTISGGSVNVPYLTADQTVRFEGGVVNVSGDRIYAGSVVFNLRDSESSVKSTGYDASVSTEWYLTDGSNIYNIGEIPNSSALNNKRLKMAGHVHTFSAPTWAWDGYEAATATFVCSDCGEKVVETATITGEITKAPTEGETGTTTYTATVTLNGTEYTDTKTKTTHAGHHTFGTPQWDWNGYESATVTVICLVDGDSFTADATITSVVTVEPTLTDEGKRVHTAAATVEGQTFTDTREETLPKITRDVSVPYRALNNKDVTVTAQKLYGDETELTTGWYAVTADLTIDYRPNCTGTVNLILCDGVTFNANMGINVGDGATLTIWGQSKGTGTINAGEYESGANIGTSRDMNTDGAEVTININGGQYTFPLSNNLSKTAIGCYGSHFGTITVNKGEIVFPSNSTRTRPAIGFAGDTSGNDKTYVVNITGGTINAGRVSQTCAIGCETGSNCSVSVSGGVITATVSFRGIGIGSYNAGSTDVDISGGNIDVDVDASGPFSQTGFGIGSYSAPDSCQINLSWRSLSAPKVTSISCSGKILLYKDFKDESENIITAGEYNASELDGKTLTPYCSHSYGEPAWTWDTDSEPFTASAGFLCSECGGYQSVTAEVTKTRSLNEYIYTGSVTIHGATYTDECETRTAAPMNLTVGGVRVTRDNADDILGDGKVSYDVTTNTLTLDNAEIPCVMGNSGAYGIYYDDTAESFNIVLIGENTIVNQRGDNGCFVMLGMDTDAYKITGGGSLSYDTQSTSAFDRQYIGISAEKPLTIDNASVNWEYLNQSNTAFGIRLISGASLTLKNHADVSFYFGYTGYSSESIALDASGSVIDVDETSSLALNAAHSAISGSVTVSDSAMAVGASVAENYRPGSAYSTWDKTTALGTYNAIHIPDNVSTHHITVETVANGSVIIDPLNRVVGDTVSVDVKPSSGYGFAYMKVKKANGDTETKIYAKEFTMPACDVTVTPVFNPIFEYAEPHLTDDLDYVPGHIRHYEEDGKCYGFLDNGCMGEELSADEVFFSYFTFTAINSGSEYRIDRYTGSTDNLTELVIPKTYNGKKITQLGMGGSRINRVLDYTGEFNLVLNENITRINARAFYTCNVRRITGDTSSLNYFDGSAFFANGSESVVKPSLDIQLNYPGSVYFGSQSLRWRTVTVHMKHAATLNLNNAQAGSITYDFTDDHLYGEPAWRWNYDNSSAAAIFTCTDDRCQHQEVVSATISGEGNSATASVTFNGKTYTDNASPMSEKMILVSRKEPYIDENGAYILGCGVEHYVIDGRNYAVNEDGGVGDELSADEVLFFSYFTFTAVNSGREYRIDRYTGPTDNLTELVIPKTYNGKKITQLGVRDNQSDKILDYTGEFDLVLNENITRINRYAFYDCKVRKITGDTSSLNYFDSSSFFASGSESDVKPSLDIQLNNPGIVHFGWQSLRWRTVTVHLKHATTLLNLNNAQAGSITYDFTDDHLYGEPTWKWSDDNSSATATFTCTNSRCKHQEPHDTTVSAETKDGNHIYTASCEFNGKTYTDTVTVPLGDEQNPFVIHNKADWTAFAARINEGYDTTAYYKLADDFDNSEAIKVTVGTSDHPFEGHFDGNGQTLNIALNDTANQGTAPFRYIRNAEIHDMTVVGSVNGKRHAAGLVGFNYGGTSTISNITVNANVSAPFRNEGYIGGVIGHNETATLTMTNVVYGGTLRFNDNYAGGLFGWSDSSTVTMTNCLFKGAYTGYAGYFHPVGCKNASDTVSVMLDRVYYTVDRNFSDGRYILTDGGVKVFTALGENQIATVVTAADREDYYIPASVSGIEDEYDYVITEITPAITVTAYDGTVLERGTDYTVTCDPNTVRTAGDYTVTVTGKGDYKGIYSKTFTVKAHTYSEPVWQWSDDLPSAALVFTREDGAELSFDADVTSKISKGVHVYTAFLFLYGTPYVDSQVGSHIYGEPVWTWSDDYKTATATFTCTDGRCGHTETVDAAVTEAYTTDSTTYTAAITFEGAEYTDAKTVESRKYFVGHSLSLTGDIRMNYYLNLTDEQAQGAVVDFSWIVNGTEKTHSVTLTAEDKTAHGYIASVPVAVAEMTYDVTATLTVGGEQLAADTYSVRQYADVILSDSFASSYTGTGSKSYENLKTLIRTMLDYGAKAQVQFVRNTDNLANKDIDYTMSNVSADMITDSPSDMRSGLDAYGLEYVGTTIVYLTKTSMRHYYKIVDQEKFDAVKDNITFNGEKVGYTSRNGEIFFEHADIAAADLDTLYALKIGDSEYQYSVLDYVRVCLSSPNAPYATVQLVQATYWYNQAANAYFGR